MTLILHKTLDNILWIGPGKLTEIPKWLKSTRRFTLYEADLGNSLYLWDKYSASKNIEIFNDVIGPEESVKFYQYNQPYFDGLSLPSFLVNLYPGLRSSNESLLRCIPLSRAINESFCSERVGLIIDFLDDELLLLNSISLEKLLESFVMISVLTSKNIDIVQKMLERNFVLLDSSIDKFGNIKSNFIRNPLYKEIKSVRSTLAKKYENEKVVSDELENATASLNIATAKYIEALEQKNINEKLIRTLKEKSIKLESDLHVVSSRSGELEKANVKLKDELNNAQSYNEKNRVWAESLLSKCERLEKELEMGIADKSTMVNELKQSEALVAELHEDLNSKTKSLLLCNSKRDELIKELEREVAKNTEFFEVSKIKEQSLTDIMDENRSQLLTIEKLQEKLSSSEKTALLNAKLMNKLKIDSDDLHSKISLLTESEINKVELISQLYNKLKNASVFIKYLRKNHPNILEEFG